MLVDFTVYIQESQSERSESMNLDHELKDKLRLS